MKRLLVLCLFTAAFSLSIMCLPAPPEVIEGQITLSIPEDQVPIDTIGNTFKFHVLHTHTNFIDSLVVTITDGPEQRILRFKQFVDDTTWIERVFTSVGIKVVDVVAYYIHGTTATGRFQLEIIERPVDSEGPELVVSTPENGATLTQTTVEVTGTVRDVSGISALTVNDSPVTANTEGAWSVLVTLTSGSNTIRVVAVDNSPAKNQKVVEIAVTCDPPPSITVPLPPTGISVSHQSSVSLRISWQPSAGAEHYQIFRSDKADGPFTTVLAAVKETEYIDNELLPATTYFYQLAAGNSAGSSLKSGTVSATTSIAAPAAPAMVNATAKSMSEISVIWSKVATATSYTVYRAISAGGTFDSIAMVNDTTYTHSGLQPNTSLYYKISAGNAGGVSAQSTVIGSATTLPRAPAAPDSVKANAQSSVLIDVSWKEAPGAESYIVFRSTSALGTFDTAGTTTSRQLPVGNLTPSRTYYFKVRAINKGGESPFSAVCSARTQDPPLQIPGVPTGLSAQARSSSSIRLSWTGVSGASAYKIYRATSETGSFDSVGLSQGTTWDNDGLSANTPYFYKIAATNNIGTSAQTAAVSARTLIAPPAVPTGVTATATSSSEIRVRWNKTANADSFEVYRSTSATGTFTRMVTTKDTVWSNTGLSVNSTFHYKVLARNAGGVSVLSSAVSATTWPAIPGVPGNLTASTLDSTRISLSWTASTGTVSSYVISRSRHTDTTMFDSIGSVTTTSYTATNLNPGTKYLFRVRAVNISGSSQNATAAAVTGARTYLLTVNAGSGTRVKPSTSPVRVSHDAATEIQVTPPTGHSFSSWSSNGTGVSFGNPSSASTTVTLTGGDATVTANYSGIPSIAVSTTALYPSCTHGTNATAETFQVWNAGSSNLSFSVTASENWVVVAPASGTSTGPDDRKSIVVSYNTAALGLGTHIAKLTVSAGNGVSQSIQILAIVLPSESSILLRLHIDNAVVNTSMYSYSINTLNPVFCPDRNGAPNRAIRFSGIDSSYIQISSDPRLDFSSSSFSIKIWLKSDGIQSAGAGIIAKGIGTEEQFAIDVMNGYYRFWVRSKDANVSIINTWTLVSDQWHILEAVYDRLAGSIRLYKDSQLIGENSAPGELLETSEPIFIGARKDPSGALSYRFNGSISEVFIHSGAVD